MEEIEITSNRKQFEVFFPKECDLNTVNRVVIRGREFVPVVRCKDCIHRFVYGENVRINVCELNHNKVQIDDWFCADGERRT